MSQQALKRIPEAKKKGLKSLDLANCELTVIPKEVAQLTSLTELDLSRNKITSTQPSLQSTYQPD
jgi:Leucine-rich repeat (LRR) protein